MARHFRFARVLVVAIVALLLAGALPAAGQDDARAQLEEALLTLEDLPVGFASQDGIITGSNFALDQEAFDANDGIAILSQVWQRESDSGPVVVLDFRLLFPTPEDARDYLRDAEAVISEREASGLKRGKQEPAIGDLHRLYSGTQTVSGSRIAFNNHLFTVGSMAAKVFVSGAPGSAAAARSIAEIAATRMGDAQIGAPIGSPEPDPAASPGATASPGPDLSGIFEAVLVARVGPGIDPTTCSPIKERAFPDELGAISCPIGTKGEVLVLRQMPSTDAMATTFVPFMGDRTGPTGTCQKEAALEPRMDGDAQVGQLACYDTEEPTRVFIWTDERFDIISWFISKPDRPFKALDRLYLEAGPIALAVSPSAPA